MNVQIILAEKATEMVAQETTIQVEGQGMDPLFYSWVAQDSGQPLPTNFEFRVRKGTDRSVETIITFLDPTTGQKVDYSASAFFNSDGEAIDLVVMPVPLPSPM